MERSLETSDFQFIEGDDGDQNINEFVNEGINYSSKNVGAAVLLTEGDKISPFLENDINFQQLSSLCDKDLELIGITDKTERSKMLEEFSQLPNQTEHFKQVLANTDIEAYKSDVLSGLAKHLDNLKTSLAAAELKLIVDRCEDVMIGDNTYSSAIVLGVLNQMNKNANIIENYLLQMKAGTLTENTIKNQEKSNLTKDHVINLAIVTGMITVGFVLFRIIKSKFH